MFYWRALVRNCCKEVREEPKYRSFCNKQINQNKHKNYVVKPQKITANHKNRHLKLMILVLFYVWEDASVWVH